MTDALTELDGVGPGIAEQLRESGFETVDDVLDADVEELAAVHMLGESSAAAILDGEDGGRGRPTGFTDEAARAALEAARRGKSKRGCERAAGVGKGTITDVGGWLDQNPTFTDADGEQKQFFGAFERARDEGEDRWIEGGALEDSGVDSSFAKFMLASSYDYKKTEKREHSGDGGGPLQIEFSEEVVETEWGESE